MNEKPYAYLRVRVITAPTTRDGLAEIEWRWLRGYGAPERLTEADLLTPYASESRSRGHVEARHLLVHTEEPRLALLRLAEIVDVLGGVPVVRCAQRDPEWSARAPRLAWMDGVQRPFQRAGAMNALPEDLVLDDGSPYPAPAPYRWMSIDPVQEPDRYAPARAWVD